MKSSEKKTFSFFESSLFALLFATVLVRGVVLFANLETFKDDPDQYQALAVNWTNYDVFGYRSIPTAYRPPLYPWVLSCLFVSDSSSVGRGASLSSESNPQFSSGTWNNSNFTAQGTILPFVDRNAIIALFHWILGLLTVFLVYQSIFLAGFKKSAFWGGLLVAVDPILLQQSRLVMTETFAVFWAALLLFLLILIFRRLPRHSTFFAPNISDSNQLDDSLSKSFQKKYPKNGKWLAFLFLLLGISLGLATLCRPAFFLLGGLIFLGFFLFCLFKLFFPFKKENKFALRWKENVKLIGYSLLFLFAWGLTLVPWTLRNQKVFGHPVFLTTHGGYTLLLGNNDDFYDYNAKKGFLKCPWSVDQSEVMSRFMENFPPPDRRHWVQNSQGRWVDSSPVKTMSNETAFLNEPDKQVSSQERGFLTEQKRKNSFSLDEIAQLEWKADQTAKNLAWKTVRRRPSDFIWTSIIRIGNLWQVWPYQTEKNRLTGRQTDRLAQNLPTKKTHSIKNELKKTGIQENESQKTTSDIFEKNERMSLPKKNLSKTGKANALFSFSKETAVRWAIACYYIFVEVSAMFGFLCLSGIFFKKTQKKNKSADLTTVEAGCKDNKTADKINDNTDGKNADKSVDNSVNIASIEETKSREEAPTFCCPDIQSDIQSENHLENYSEINRLALSGLWFGTFLLFLSVQVPHLIYWTNMRMRAPLIPVVAVWTVLFWTVIISERRKKSKKRTDNFSNPFNSSRP